MLKSGSSVIGAQTKTCTKGTEPLGCFAFSSSQVVSLFSAIPLDCRIQHAFPIMPDLPKHTAWLITLVRSLLKEPLASIVTSYSCFGQVPESCEVIFDPHVAKCVYWKRSSVLPSIA